MLISPAIDLKDGRCVRLKQGDMKTATVFSDDPVAMAERIEISRDIAASPEAVYAAISDVTRMGEWSEECHSCEWHEGFDGPAVGATSGSASGNAWDVGLTYRVNYRMNAEVGLTRTAGATSRIGAVYQKRQESRFGLSYMFSERMRGSLNATHTRRTFPGASTGGLLVASEETRILVGGALEFGREADIPPIVRRAAGVLVGAGVKVADAVEPATALLTPGERRVVELAARGETNRRIAQQLFVTVKAVEKHLDTAYVFEGDVVHATQQSAEKVVDAYPTWLCARGRGC